MVYPRNLIKALRVSMTGNISESTVIVPANYLVRRVKVLGIFSYSMILIPSIAVTVKDGLPLGGILFSISVFFGLLLCIRLSASLCIEDEERVTLVVQSWWRRLRIEISSVSEVKTTGYSGFLMYGGPPTWTVIAVENGQKLQPINCTVDFNPWTARSRDRLKEQVTEPLSKN